jgi:hypothetical protein
MTQVSSSSVWGVAERIVVTPVGKIRSELVRLLGQRGFTLTTDQLTVLEGSRGSAFAGASRNPSRVPVQVRVRLTAGDPGCAIWLEVRDSWKLPMSRPVAVYQDIVADIMQSLDELLRRLDPLAPPFPDPIRSWHAFVESDGGADRASARFSQAANRYLDHDAGDAPKGWRDNGIVSVVTPRGVADLPIDTMYGMVTAGTLVASKPGQMPVRLVSQVELVVGMFERMLETAGSWSGNSWIELDDKAVPVVEFLVQQARIREAVPLRTLQVCVTCRLAKVVNPDYSRLRSRTNKLRTLQSSLGAFVGPQGISPFVLIGKLAQLNQLDPEFVCPRCQGLHAENSIITFCPHCGEQRDESALRECGKCKYDFRSLAKTKDLWHEPLPMPAIDQYPGMPGVPAQGDPIYPPGYPNDQGTPFPAPFAGEQPPSTAASANGQQYGQFGYPPSQYGYPPEQYAVPALPAEHHYAPPPFPAEAHAAPAPHLFPAEPDAAPAPSPAEYQYPPTPFPEPGYLSGPFAVQPYVAPGAPGEQYQGAPTLAVGAGSIAADSPSEQQHLLPAWYPDPSGRHQFRWWDGLDWGQFVLDNEQSAVDPL